jgi:hypothetical protein
MPNLKIEGDATGAVKAVDALTQSTKKAGDEAQKTGGYYDSANRKIVESLRQQKKEQDEAAKSAKQLEQAAARIVRENEGPQQRYNRLIAELKTLTDAGKLSQDQATAAAARYKTEIFGASEATTAFGRAGSFLASHFMGLFGPGAIISGAISMMHSYRSEVEAVMELGKGGVHGLGQLMELAIAEHPNDPKAQRKLADDLVARAIGFWKSGAAPSPAEGGRLEFQLWSAQIKDLKQQQLIAELGKHGIVPDPSGFVTGLSALQSSYPNASVNQLFGRAVVAATIAPTYANLVIANAAKAAAQGKPVGVDDVDTLVMTGLLTKKQVTPEEAQTRVNRFFTGLEKTGFHNMPELKGKGIWDIVDKMAEGGYERENVTKYVGKEIRGIQAARGLIELRGLGRQLSITGHGDVGGFAEQAIALAKDTPAIANAVLQTAGKNARAGSIYEHMGAWQLYDAALDQYAATRRNAGEAEFGTRIQLIGSGFTKLMGMFGEGVVDEELRHFARDGKITDQELLKAIHQHLESLDNKTQATPIRGRTE